MSSINQRTFIVTVRELDHDRATDDNPSGAELYAVDDEPNQEDNWPLPLSLMYPPDRPR